jgi:putative membrane protein
MVVRASSDYRWVRWFWAAVGWALATAAMAAVEARSDWDFTVLHLVEYQLAGALLGAFLGLWRPFQRLVLTPHQTAWRVHREALANFTASGLHETRDRTGVLVYISELERRVQILADSGIHGKAGEPYWKDLVTEIVTGIRRGKACEALIAAIGRMGEKLGEHFPPRPDDTNELSNEVRLGPADIV